MFTLADIEEMLKNIKMTIKNKNNSFLSFKCISLRILITPLKIINYSYYKKVKFSHHLLLL